MSQDMVNIIIKWLDGLGYMINQDQCNMNLVEDVKRPILYVRCILDLKNLKILSN